MPAFLKNPVVRFLGLGAILYLAWYSFYEFFIRPKTALDARVIDAIVDHSRALLAFVGYDLAPSESTSFDKAVALLDSPGVTVGAPCDGMALFGLFTVFVAAYPGKWLHKTWFIPAGILVIHGINVVRVAVLAVIMKLSPNWLAFNHDYTFTLLVYSVVFALWYIWVQRFWPTLQPSKT